MVESGALREPAMERQPLRCRRQHERVGAIAAIEIGDQEMFGFVVRALDYGGLVFEDDKPDTLAEAMAALEKGLTEYFEREGIDID